jgi:hypothetical protein
MLFPIARRFFYRVADACKIVAIRTTSAPTRQDVIPRRPGRTRDHKESAQIGEKNAGDLSEGTSGGATLLRVPRSEQERAAECIGCACLKAVHFTWRPILVGVLSPA